MNELVVILDNIRSTYNVGSILRTCDGFGIKKLIVCGLTPYPLVKEDDRLPHVSKRAHEQIAKTALGAEQNVEVNHFDKLGQAIEEMRSKDFEIWAIEQDTSSVPLNTLQQQSKKIAIVLGNEIGGVNLTEKFDKIIEIPMKGKKESFNVSVTAGIVIYHLTQK